MKLLLLVLIAGVSASSYGILSNNIDVDIQQWELLSLPPTPSGSPSVPREFTTFNCQCNGAACNTQYVDSPTNTIPNSTSLGASGNKLCT